jgi:hypothetical protein
MFKVSDEEWAKYIQPDKKRSIVCKPCFDRIKRLIDKGEKGE